MSASVDVSEQLAAIETLVLDASLDHDALAWVGDLPRLRTVVTRWLPFGQQQALAEQLPHVQIIGEDAARLRNEWLDLPSFDPLAVASWPKLA